MDRITSGSDHRLAADWLARRVDPRRSIAGKFVAAAVAFVAVTAAVLLVGVWWVTTELVATADAATTVYRGALVLGALLIGVQVAALALIGRSVRNGLLALDRDARDVVEGRGFESTIEPGRDDEIGRVHWSVAELRDELATQVDALESLNRDLATVATDQSRTLAAAGGGDLTQRMDEETQIPQFDALARNFNEMMNRTESLVGEVHAFSRTVADAAEGTADGVHDVHDAAESVTEATDSIEAGTNHQRTVLGDTAEDVTALSEGIQSIAAEADEVAQRSEQAADAAAAGRVAAEEGLAELETIDETSDRAVEGMDALTSITEEVGAITDLIGDMAGQTNHIAINAQIEAANEAGAGNGDAAQALATRIKELAEDTDEAAREIEDRLESLQSQTEAAVAGIQETREAVDRGTETIEDSLQALAAIDEAASETAAGIAAIDDATDREAERAAAVADRVEALEAIGARTAEEASTAATATREQRSSLGTIDQRVRRLAAAAGDLDDRLSTFTVRKPASVPDRSAVGDRR